MRRFVPLLAVFALLLLAAADTEASSFRARGQFNRGRQFGFAQRGVVTHQRQFAPQQFHRGFGQVHHR